MADQRTTICFPFAGDCLGGSHLSTLGLLRRLPPDQFRILVVPEVPGGRVAELFSEFEIVPDPGRLGRPATVGEPFGFLKLFRTLPDLPARVGFLRAQGVDIVHSNDGRTHANWSLAARFAGIRVRRQKLILFTLTGLMSALTGVFWALLERSRWRTVVMGVAAGSVAVMVWRMQVICSGIGA